MATIGRLMKNFAIGLKTELRNEDQTSVTSSKFFFLLVLEWFGIDGHPGFDFLQPFDDDPLAWLESLINDPEIAGPLTNLHGTDVDLVFRRDDGNLVTPLHLSHGPLWHENRLLFGLGHRPYSGELAGPQEIVGIRKQRRHANGARFSHRPDDRREEIVPCADTPSPRLK